MSFPAKLTPTAKLSFISGLSVLALGMATHSQAHDTSDGASVEIVVTGTGYRVQKNALMSHVDILTRADINEKPAQGLGDMLAYMPGIRSSSFAPGASRPMIRGLDGFRVMVLNNGMGMVDVSALSPDHAVPSSPTEAKRIEVLRGPSALAYGGNAIGGIVNVIDERIPNAPAKNGFEGSFSAQASSVDKGRQIAFIVKSGTGPLVFTFDAFTQKAEDYSVPVPPLLRSYTDAAGEAPDTRDHQTNSAQDMRTIGTGVSWVGEQGFAGLSYKNSDYTYGIAIEEGVQINLHQERWDVRGALDLSGYSFNHLDVSAGYSDYNHAEMEGSDIGTQFLSKGGEFRAALVRDNQGKVSGTLGLSSLNRDFEALGEEAFVPSTNTQQSGIFSQYRYDSGLWGIEGGGRLDQTKIRSAHIDFARSFDTISLSLGGFYRPSKQGFVGFSLTRSERAPADVELLADGPHAATGQYIIGNRDFRTEVGSSLELTGHLSATEDRRFSLDAHIYTSHFDRFIDLQDTGTVDAEDMPVFEYVQTQADIYGLELEVNMRLGTVFGQALSLNGTYDYTHGQTDIGPVVRIPPQALSLKFRSQGGDWDSYAEVRKVEARKDRLANYETPTAGYVMINLFTSRKVPSHPNMSVFAEVRNLGDVQIREATSSTKDVVVGQGRNVRIGIACNF